MLQFSLEFYSFFGTAETVKTYLNKPANWTRKFIHISVGLVVCICPFLFKVNILIALCLLFIVINTYLYNKNKVNSMYSIDRASYDRLFFQYQFLSYRFFLGKANNFLYFNCYPYMLILWPQLSVNALRSILNPGRTVEGSLAMFSSTFIIVLFWDRFHSGFFNASFYLPIHILLGLALFTSLCATLSEMLSIEVPDNFSIPVITFFSYEIFLINYTQMDR